MTAAPNFRKVLQSVRNDEKVVPLLRSALWDPSFKSFTVKVEGFRSRPPDGWFHPSTHPLWSRPMLYHYLAGTPGMKEEPFDPQGTIAVTAGTFFHSFVQRVLVDHKVLEKQPVTCGCGAKHPERAEVYLEDREALSRGHSDGVTYEGDGFEFKTMHPAKMGKIPKGSPSSQEVLDWFLDRCPDYYAQAQEYLRMSGRQRMVVVIMSLTYPFEMREIHVPYNPFAATKVRDKYAEVIQAVADRRPFRCECGPTNTSCPVSMICWGSS